MYKNKGARTGLRALASQELSVRFVDTLWLTNITFEKLQVFLSKFTVSGKFPYQTGTNYHRDTHEIPSIIPLSSLL